MAFVKTISVGLNTEKDKDILDFLEVMSNQGTKASPLVKLAIRDYIKASGMASKHLGNAEFKVSDSHIVDEPLGNTETNVSDSHIVEEPLVKTKDNKFTDFSERIEVEEVMSSSNKVVKAKDKVNLNTGTRTVKTISFNDIVI